jgi:hypothetical protein
MRFPQSKEAIGSSFSILKLLDALNDGSFCALVEAPVRILIIVLSENFAGAQQQRECGNGCL